jgi:hypothetical protein
MLYKIIHVNLQLKIKTKFMEATLSHQPLNATQIHFLQSLQFVKSEEKLRELKQLVSDFYFRQLGKETDKWWEENNMTDEKLEEMLNLYSRVSNK